jgi:predicted signal transduction protein with EAL and GGDEF domain
VPIEGQEVSISASIGLAAGRDPRERADDLLRNADVAMYRAKALGKSQYAVFEPTMHAAIIERHALSSELTRGIVRGELAVYYQPIISLATGALYGVEALVRWRHPTRGIVGPDEFIRLAEESGAILGLGRWVLLEACREVATWQQQWSRPEPLVLTINLSAAQLQDADFVDDLGRILDETGFPATSLVLELTETAMFHDTHTTIARLQALRQLGIRIAIDDFGTGYSSLGYLAPVPGRHPQDRSRVRRRRRRWDRRLGLRARHRRARPDPRPADRRRRRRGWRAARSPSGDGLRVRPGIPVRQAGRWSNIHGEDLRPARTSGPGAGGGRAAARRGAGGAPAGQPP